MESAAAGNMRELFHVLAGRRGRLPVDLLSLLVVPYVECFGMGMLASQSYSVNRF